MIILYGTLPVSMTLLMFLVLLQCQRPAEEILTGINDSSEKKANLIGFSEPVKQSLWVSTTPLSSDLGVSMPLTESIQYRAFNVINPSEIELL